MRTEAVDTQEENIGHNRQGKFYSDPLGVTETAVSMDPSLYPAEE